MSACMHSVIIMIVCNENRLRFQQRATIFFSIPFEFKFQLKPVALFSAFGSMFQFRFFMFFSLFILLFVYVDAIFLCFVCPYVGDGIRSQLLLYLLTLILWTTTRQFIASAIKHSNRSFVHHSCNFA